MRFSRFVAFFTLFIFAVLRYLFKGPSMPFFARKQLNTPKKSNKRWKKCENGAPLVLVLESRATQHFFCLLVLTHLVNIYNRSARCCRRSALFCFILYFVFVFASFLFYFNFFLSILWLNFCSRWWIGQSKFFSTNELTLSKSMPSHLTRVHACVWRSVP